MESINFLTKKYLENLEIQNYVRKNLAIFIIIFIVLYIISFGIGQFGQSYQHKIDMENVFVDNNNKEIKALKIKMAQKTNLGVEIEIIEDIFLQKKLRVSEIFMSLGENVPKNVWLETLIYEGKEVRLQGFSIRDGENKESEENAYYFEERMLDSGIYESVTLDFLKKSEKLGEKTNEFEYLLILK